MTFQAWKMVFLNSMTFHDQGAPCLRNAVPSINEPLLQLINVANRFLCDVRYR